MRGGRQSDAIKEALHDAPEARIDPFTRLRGANHAGRTRSTPARGSAISALSERRICHLRLRAPAKQAAQISSIGQRKGQCWATSSTIG